MVGEAIVEGPAEGVFAFAPGGVAGHLSGAIEHGSYAMMLTAKEKLAYSST